jgi:hypothetical protein
MTAVRRRTCCGADAAGYCAGGYEMDDFLEALREILGLIQFFFEDVLSHGFLEFVDFWSFLLDL